MSAERHRLRKTGGITSCCLAALLVFSSSVLPLTPDQEKEEKHDSSQTVLRDEQQDYPERRRSKETWEYLVDLPGTVLHLPFWLAYSITVPLADWIARNRLLPKIADTLAADDGSRALMPTYISRTGAGLKLYLKHLAGQGSRLDLSAAWGLAGQKFYGLELRRLRLSGVFQTDLSLHYRYLSEESFFGIGNDTWESTESLFGLRRTSAEAAFRMDLSPRIRLNAGLILESNRVRNWRDERVLPDGDGLDPGGVRPHGLSKASLFWGLTGKFSLDTRDSPANPRNGWSVELRTAWLRAAEGDPFGYWKAGADVSRFFHLFYDRILLLRLAAEWTRPLGKREIPFYALSELGRRETVRGFERGRFRDRDMMLGTMEYRFPLAKRPLRTSVDGLLFVDTGRVFGDMFEGFGTKGFHVGYGGGFRIYRKSGTILTLVLGRSRDGYRLYIVLNE